LVAWTTPAVFNWRFGRRVVPPTPGCVRLVTWTILAVIDWICFWRYALLGLHSLPGVSLVTWHGPTILGVIS
jgi:hypothetical protein